MGRHRPARGPLGLSPRRPGEEDTYLWSRTCWTPRPDSKQVLLTFSCKSGPSPCLLEPWARAGLILFGRLTVSLLKPACVGQGSCLNIFFVMEIKFT